MYSRSLISTQEVVLFYLWHSSSASMSLTSMVRSQHSTLCILISVVQSAFHILYIDQCCSIMVLGFLASFVELLTKSRVN